MIKLNKCRTLYKFDEAILSSFLGQGQQTTDANKEETKEAQNQPENKDKTETEKSDTTGAEKKAQANDEENKSENTKKDALENPEKTSSDTQYLFFDADEFIITTYQNESGWWAGYKDTGDVNSAQKLGYFPSNYVQVIETYEVPTSNSIINHDYLIISIAPAEGVAENVNTEEAFTWNDYAKYSYLDDNQILVQERTKKLNDYRAPEHRNQEGIMGYKKIKIHESRSHALNPAKGGKVVTSQVAIKDQSPVSKAYRQMHHYFDYDSWVEQRNQNPVAKAKADPTKKKTKKKTLDW